MSIESTLARRAILTIPQLRALHRMQTHGYLYAYNQRGRTCAVLAARGYAQPSASFSRQYVLTPLGESVINGAKQFALDAVLA